MITDAARHKLLVLTGQCFENTGELILQSGSFSFQNFIEIFTDQEVCLEKSVFHAMLHAGRDSWKTKSGSVLLELPQAAWCCWSLLFIIGFLAKHSFISLWISCKLPNKITK